MDRSSSAYRKLVTFGIVLLSVWVLFVFPLICAFSVDYTNKAIQFVLAIPFSSVVHIVAWWCASQVLGNASAYIDQHSK